MTNEIKEILDYVFRLAYGECFSEEFEDIKKAENYITNLQERIDKAIEYINKYEYEKYCPSPYEKDKYIMREEKEGQDLLNILRGDE